MSILELLDNATIEEKAFVGHPMIESSLEEKILYLQALALVMNVTDEINTEEKNYIRSLIHSWGVDDSILDDVIVFAKQSNEEATVNFYTCFETHPNKYNFLFDAFMMIGQNLEMTNEVCAFKQQAIHKITQSLGVSKHLRDTLASMADLVKSNKGTEFYIVLFESELSSENFSYLFFLWIDDIALKVIECLQPIFNLSRSK